MTSRTSRKINISDLRSPGDWVAFVIATAFGAGLSPWAPGTAGALVALPLCYAVNTLGLQAGILFWCFATGIATWSAQVFIDRQKVQDHQSIVIDEVVGMGITALALPISDPVIAPWGWILAFLLFRFFDIVKLPPVRALDRWSKNKTHTGWSSGFGVIADDIVAGLQGAAVIWVLAQWNLWPGQ